VASSSALPSYRQPSSLQACLDDQALNSLAPPSYQLSSPPTLHGNHLPTLLMDQIYLSEMASLPLTF